MNSIEINFIELCEKNDVQGCVSLLTSSRYDLNDEIIASKCPSEVLDHINIDLACKLKLLNLEFTKRYIQTHTSYIIEDCLKPFISIITCRSSEKGEFNYKYSISSNNSVHYHFIDLYPFNSYSLNCNYTHDIRSSMGIVYNVISYSNIFNETALKPCHETGDMLRTTNSKPLVPWKKIRTFELMEYYEQYLKFKLLRCKNEIETYIRLKSYIDDTHFKIPDVTIEDIEHENYDLFIANQYQNDGYKVYHDIIELMLIDPNKYIDIFIKMTRTYRPEFIDLESNKRFESLYEVYEYIMKYS